MDLIQELGALALGSRLRRLSDRVMKDGVEIYQENGLDFNPRWFPLYRLLLDAGELPVMEAAARLSVTHPAVIQIAKDMKRKGMLQSRKDPADARGRLLALSGMARQLEPEMRKIWEDIEQAARELVFTSGRDLLADLQAVEGALDAQDFRARVRQQKKRRQWDEVEIVGFVTDLRDYFRKLNEEWLEEYFVVEDIDREILGNPEKLVIEPGGQILFARLDGEIVGTCAMRKAAEGIYELTKMGVTPAVQGRQVGYKLGIACLDWARRQKAKRVYLETHGKLKPALRLYEKLGFRMAPNPYLPSKYARSEIYMEIEL